jgi:hypothetical protein
VEEIVMKEYEIEPAKGEEVIVRVPKGTAQYVRVVEVDPDQVRQDITVQVSRERKSSVSSAIGVIVK